MVLPLAAAASTSISFAPLSCRTSCLSVCLVCLYVYLSACLFVCPFVCLSAVCLLAACFAACLSAVICLLMLRKNLVTPVKRGLPPAPSPRFRTARNNSSSSSALNPFDLYERRDLPKKRHTDCCCCWCLKTKISRHARGTDSFYECATFAGSINTYSSMPTPKSER